MEPLGRIQCRRVCDRTRGGCCLTARAGPLPTPARSQPYFFDGGLFPRPPPDGSPVRLGQFGLLESA